MMLVVMFVSVSICVGVTSALGVACKFLVYLNSVKAKLFQIQKRRLVIGALHIIVTYCKGEVTDRRGR